MKVTFIDHSGYLVETEESYLLFDYWKGEIPSMKYGKKLYVFSSHAHHDHYTRDIFKLQNSCSSVFYILSEDIKNADRSWRQAENVCFTGPDQTVTAGDCEITTLLSNDEGVAFLVKTEGKVIYHAGDLHWWDWPGEPEEENRYMGEVYKREIEKIRNEPIDCAFVVLDPRQEESGSLGMEYFLNNVHARYVFPMHFWEDYRYVSDYIDETMKRHVTSRLMNVTRKGQEFEVE